LVVRRGVKQLVEEVFAVRAIDALGLSVGVGDPDELQEAVPERIVVATLARASVPIAVAHLLRRLQAVVAEMAKAMVVVDNIVGGPRNARAGNPNRRMWLLDRPRP